MKPYNTCKCGVAISASVAICQKCFAASIAPQVLNVVLKTWNSDGGRRFKETGEFRQAVTGEFILAPLGVAQANNLTKEKFRILKEIVNG